MFSNRRKAVTGAVMAAVLAAGTWAMVPTEAAAFQSSAFLTQTSNGGLVQDVAWKKNKWKKYPRYSGNHHHHYRGGGNNWVGPLVGGMVLGGMLAAPYYGGPSYAPRYGYSSHDAYCHARFRSYNSATGLYLGYDGRYHRCR
jgi:hypothetical protein